MLQLYCSLEVTYMLSVLNENTVSTFLKMARKEIEKNNVYFVGYRTVESNGK